MFILHFPLVLKSAVMKNNPKGKSYKHAHQRAFDPNLREKIPGHSPDSSQENLEVNTGNTHANIKCIAS